jgi:hypothetical protein
MIFAIPLLVVGFWLLIPLIDFSFSQPNGDDPGYIQIFWVYVLIYAQTYYLVALAFIIILFEGWILPGIRRLHIIIYAIAAELFFIGYFIMLYFTSQYYDKWLHAFIALVPIFGATFLYLSHAFTVNRWAKTKGNLTDQLLQEDQIVTDGELDGSNSEKPISAELVQHKNILGEPLPHTLTVREATHPWRSLVIGVVFMFVVGVVWLINVLFVTGVFNQDYSAVAKTFISIAYKICAVIIQAVMVVVGQKLLRRHQMTAIVEYSISLAFLLFFRTLFLKSSDLAIFIALTVINVVIDIIIYPVRLSKGYYSMLTKIADVLRKRFKNFPDSFPEPYDVQCREICIGFYFSKMAAVYSLVTFMAFTSLLRYLPYNTWWYPFRVELLDEEGYKNLMMFSGIAAGVEIFSSICLRIAIRLIFKWNIGLFAKEIMTDKWVRAILILAGIHFTQTVYFFLLCFRFDPDVPYQCTY